MLAGSSKQKATSRRKRMRLTVPVVMFFSSNRHHFRFKYSFADDAELSVSSNCGCSARSSSTCRQELPLHTNLTLCVRTIDIPFLSHVRATLVCIFSVHHKLPPLLAQASSQLRAGQSFFRGKYNNSNNNINNNSKITIMIQNV